MLLGQYLKGHESRVFSIQDYANRPRSCADRPPRPPAMRGWLACAYHDATEACCVLGDVESDKAVFQLSGILLQIGRAVGRFVMLRQVNFRGLDLLARATGHRCFDLPFLLRARDSARRGGV